MMKNIFPKFNRQEVLLTSSLKSSAKDSTADALRGITLKAQKDQSKKI